MRRLIDANALICELNKQKCSYRRDIDLCIENAPTIETKEIKYYDEDEQMWKIGKVIVEEL